MGGKHLLNDPDVPLRSLMVQVRYLAGQLAAPSWSAPAKSRCANAGRICLGLTLVWTQKAWMSPLTAQGLGKILISHNADIA